MSVLGVAPRRFLLAAGLAITMAATPVAATALIGADTVPVPRSVADPGDPGGCTIGEQNASVSLDCVPDPTPSPIPTETHHNGNAGGPGGSGRR
jgi:hypothetical protein